jgi:predicted nucleic acid-binding protein
VILADTSVWIDHLRSTDSRMNQLLSAGEVVVHPFVVAEIALGSLHSRRRRLAGFDLLRSVNVAEISEVRHLIESHSLYAKGLGLTDVHLIASCMMTFGIQLWTRDKSLADTARSMGLLANLP